MDKQKHPMPYFINLQKLNLLAPYGGMANCGNISVFRATVCWMLNQQWNHHQPCIKTENGTGTLQITTIFPHVYIIENSVRFLQSIIRRLIRFFQSKGTSLK